MTQADDVLLAEHALLNHGAWAAAKEATGFRVSSPPEVDRNIRYLYWGYIGTKEKKMETTI